MGSRTWIKIYCDKWLEGSISEETPAIRGVWAGLLALAGSGKFGDTGQIMAINGVGFGDKQLARILKISPKLWTSAKKRFLIMGRIGVEKETNIITITNWKIYQSEYKRQKPYRNEKLQPEVTSRVTRVVTQEKEIEKEKKKENSSSNVYSLYEQEIGDLTPMIAEELKAAEEIFGYDMIEKAIREAVKANVKKWNYISKILENWRSEPQTNLISGQSVEKAIRIAKGEEEALPTNVKKFQKELDRRKIKWR